MDENLRHLFQLGRDHYAAGEYDRAEEYLTQFVEKHRGFADVFNMLGVIFHNQGRFADAERAFESALDLNPNYTEAALNLSVTYNDRGKYGKAREVYERVLSNSERQQGRLDPFARGKIANMHADIGAVYAGVGMYDEAVEEYRKALELCPHFVDIRTRLGHIYRESGKHDEAIKEYERAKTTRPEYIPARVAIGITYYALGKREAALNEWNEALDIDPDNKSASLYLRMVSSNTKQAPKPGSALDDE
jgi:tetratricopeptide (TPR) repeat protein